MIRVAGVRFQQDGKMLYYNSDELTPHVGDYIVAETSHGPDLGEVILGVNEMEDDQVKTELPKILRIATAQDIQQATDNRARERDAYAICQRKIMEHKLEMKLVSVESTFDNNKMMFYFTANGRVDFRALVRDLASTFKTRIELRQIGVRDEARMLGGLGPCGRPICCGAFLSDFQPVSIKMAKEQNLSLNPTKISGVCGRLMCCLKYEQDQYEATRKRMPRVGREVVTPDGNGMVTDLNVVKETVSVRIPVGDTTEIREYPLEQISKPGSHSAPQQQEPAEAEEPLEEIDALMEGEVSLELPLDQEEEEALAEMEENLSEEATRKPRPSRPMKGERPPRNNRFGPRSEKKEETEGEPAPEEERKQENRRPPRPRNDRSRKPAREQRFGQPVRRENPDREKKAATAPEGKPQEQGNRPAEAPQPAQPVKAPEANPNATKPAVNNKSKGWADALEKAMKAADQ